MAHATIVTMLPRNISQDYQYQSEASLRKPSPFIISNEIFLSIIFFLDGGSGISCHRLRN